MLPFWHHLQKIDFKWFINDAKKATFTCSGTIELIEKIVQNIIPESWIRRKEE